MSKETYFQAVVQKVDGATIIARPVDGSPTQKEVKVSTTGEDARSISYKEGERIIIAMTKQPNGAEQFYVADFVRTTPLLFLFFLFLFFVFAVGRWKGLTSFIGMAISFGVIIWFIIPSIIIGNNPVLISLLGSLIIIPVTFYLAHGLNRKTTIAVVSTFISLALTGALATVFVYVTKLTGYDAEEAVFLQTIYQGGINIKDLLLAGIIIGAMGILDDITVSQASIVHQLKIANPKYTTRQLFSHAMEVGRDHISSLVNTLILVYTGSSLPLLLLFQNAQISYWLALNNEMIATEIVRTLVSSIGIIAAVPIATILAVLFLRK